MDANIYVKPLQGWEIVQKLSAVIHDAWPERTVHTFSISTNFGQEAAPANKLGKELLNEEWTLLVSRFREQSFLEVNTVNISFDSSCSLTYRADDSKHKAPCITLTANVQHAQEQAERERLKLLAAAIQKHFVIVPITMLNASMIAEDQLAGFRFAEQVIASLASETSRINQAMSSSFQSFVDGVKSRTLELENQFQEKSNDLDKRFQEKQDELSKEHARKIAESEERETAFAEREKAFELRNNTAVRRDLLREFKKKIEEQTSFQVSRQTSQKRSIIHIVCGLTIAISLACIVVFVWKLYHETTFEWRLLIPIGTWTAMFISTGIYYIRWNDQWFRDHARVEFENRRFSSDIVRASWIAELYFEWKEKKEIGMPPELVQSFAKGLFETPSFDGRLHPMDQFNDFLKQLSSLEVSKGGVKFTQKESKG